MATDLEAAQRRRKLMRRVNVPMRAVLGLPFPTPLGRSLMLLHYTGRKTGTSYRQPLSYVRDGDVLLTPGGGRWTLSLEAGEPVRLRIRGRDVMARPELITDPEEIQRQIRAIEAGNPRAGGFIPIPREADGSLEAAPLQAAIDHGFCIVRWHPTGSSARV
ncbi:nitroreductase/quinone reductase family protein [Monashia sp. NPDC004114]